MMGVFTKTLNDKKWFIFGWSLGFVFLAGLMVTFFPSMKIEGALDELLKSMPPAMQGFVGNLADLREFSTYLASQMFDIRMQILGGVMAIVLALGLTVGDEDAGTMRTTLALPVSRTKLLIQKWLALVLIIGVVVGASGLGVLAIQPTIGEAVDLGVLGRLLVMAWLVTVAIATVTFAAAMATGSRSLSTTVGVLVVATSFIISTFSQGVDWLKDFEPISVYYYYPAVDIAKDAIKVSDVLVLSAIALVPLVVSWVLFRQRDVK